MESCQRELHAHGDDDQSHKPCHHVAQKATRVSWARPAVRNKRHNDPRYERGYHDRDECRNRQRQLRMRNSERDDPGNVPGLAANRITGPSDRVSAAPFFEGSWTCGELPRNMENPIQVRTPPPAIEKASSETPKTCSNLAPANAAMTRMTSTASATLVASANRVARV